MSSFSDQVQRLVRMLKDGYPRSDLNSLFFKESSGYTVVPPHLTAALAWLASFDPEVRRLATRHAPECLIDEGDPSGIPADERRNILRAYVDRFGDRERVFHSFDSVGLQRFATAELSTTIRELINAPGEPDHIRELLLRLIRRGRLSMLVDEAVKVALDSATPAAVRLTAIRAVCDSGVESARIALRSLLGTAAVQEPEVAAALLDGLFPAVISVSDAVDLLDRVVRPGGISVTNLDVLAPELPRRCSPDDRRELLGGLLSLIRAPNSRPGHPKVSARGVWLAECITALLDNIAEDPMVSPETLSEVLELLQDAAYHSDGSHGRGFSTVLERYPELRRRLFWYAAGASRSPQGKPARTYWDVMAARARVGAEDLSWLREDVRTRVDARERALAFDCVWYVANDVIKDPEERRVMLSSVADEADAVHGDGALGRKLSRKLNPPFHPPIEAIVQMHLRRRTRDLRKARIMEENRRTLNSSLSEISDGTRFGALRHLFQPFFFGDKLAQAGTKIAEEYGAPVAEAAKQGLRAFWKTNPAPGVKEWPRNQTPDIACMGLLGIELDVGEGMSMSDLSVDLRRSAIGYAVWELNRFPGWFDDVARDHAPLVREVLEEAIRLDYAGSDLGHVIHKLTSASEPARRGCAPILAERLRSADPPDIQVLKSVLEILEGTDAIQSSEMGVEHQRVNTGIEAEAKAAEFISEVQAAIDPNVPTSLLVYETLGRAVWVWVVDRNGLRAAAQLPISRRTLAKWGAAWMNAIAIPDVEKEPELARKLYSALVEPVVAQLARQVEGGVQLARLGVLLPGTLPQLPFHALAGPKGRVIEQHDVFYIPSLRGYVDAVSRSTQKSEVVHAFGPSEPPQAQREAVSLGTTNHAFCGDRATRANFLAQAQVPGVLHAASHGHVQPRNPFYSHLSFERGEPVYGYDILGIDLKSWMVTLTACNSGVPAAAQSREITSLGGVFLAAGIPSVVMAAWSVHEEPTVSMMRSFYAQMAAGIAPVAALSAVEREAFKSGAPTLYWAPLYLMGRER